MTLKNLTMDPVGLSRHKGSIQRMIAVADWYYALIHLACIRRENECKTCTEMWTNVRDWEATAEDMRCPEEDPCSYCAAVDNGIDYSSY